ncbi:Hypothetical protein FKW44_017719 [Caligus rogercresseyi]|uniref:Uncharacterized protein n=1 Tax=Caligus rogercresseyi TaxID=217165 RepID=A0A7T8JX55_CALRO|nr:Hypothetical protein FKW44_017719 [Caligus rogercresseyi]
MLMLYLPGFCLYAPWRNECGRQGEREEGTYNLVTEVDEDQHVSPASSSSSEEDDDDDEEVPPPTSSSATPSSCPFTTPTASQKSLVPEGKRSL